MRPSWRLIVTLAFTWLAAGFLSGPALADDPPMLAPNIGSGQLAVDVHSAPYKPRLTPELNVPGAEYWGLYKICVTEKGKVGGVSTVKSAHPDLDTRWMKVIETWRYRPYTVRGEGKAFCYTLRLQVAAAGAAGGSATAESPPPKMLAPNIGSGQLAVDVTKPPHRPTLPPELAGLGNTIWGLFKICVDTAGHVSRVKVVKSADPTADGAWSDTIRGWRYRPYVANGTTFPFCYTLRLQVNAD